MSILHGKNVIVRAAASGSVAAIALQRSVELSESCEIREIASNTSDSQEFIPGRSTWSLTVNGLMSTLGSRLKKGVLYNVEIFDGTGTEGGTAYVSQVRVIGTVGNLAQQSVQFQGTGPLGAATQQSS